MSGLLGTIGNPDKDKIAAWIYRYTLNIPTKERNHIFKLVGKMSQERNNLIKINNWEFRQRMAKFVRSDFIRQINKQYGDTPLSTRLRNLAVRNYRQALYEDEE